VQNLQIQTIILALIPITILIQGIIIIQLLVFLLFFILFLQIEDRLAFEKNQKLSPRVELTPKSEFKESNSSSSQPDSMGSPLYLLNPIPNPNPNPVSPDNSGPAVDFLSDTETPQEEEQVLERNEVREEKKEAKRLD
jgi:hypothetical protein